VSESALQLKEKYQVLPSMAPEQFEALKADIEERGVLTPIDVDEDGHILDGHLRYRACVELGLTDFPTIVRPGLSEEDRRMFARKSNMLRRHLSREQVRLLIAGAAQGYATMGG
jgi:ParB-like chromosome segregation protein Spo0J